jgi:hypothetical protein
LAPCSCDGDRGPLRCGYLQAADVAAAKGVEHALDEYRAAATLAWFAGLRAARGDPVSRRADRVVLAGPLHDLDGGPADQFGALLGDPAAGDLGVGFTVPRGRPAQLASCVGPANLLISPISAQNTAPSPGLTPGFCCTAAKPVSPHNRTLASLANLSTRDRGCRSGAGRSAPSPASRPATRPGRAGRCPPPRTGRPSAP